MAPKSRLRWGGVESHPADGAGRIGAHIWLVDQRSRPIRDQMKEQHIEMLRVHPGLKRLLARMDRTAATGRGEAAAIRRTAVEMSSDPFLRSEVLEQWSVAYGITQWTLAHFVGFGGSSDEAMQAVEVPAWTEQVFVERIGATWLMRVPSPPSPALRDVVDAWMKADPRWPLPESLRSGERLPTQYPLLGRASYPAMKVMADLQYYEEWTLGEKTVADIWDETDGSASLQAFVTRLRRVHEHLESVATLGLPANKPASKTLAILPPFRITPEFSARERDKRS